MSKEKFRKDNSRSILRSNPAGVDIKNDFNKSSAFPRGIRPRGKNLYKVTHAAEPRGIRKALDKITLTEMRRLVLNEVEGSRADDNFKFFFGGKFLNSQSEYQMYCMKNKEINQKKKGAVPEGRAPIMSRLEALRLSREYFSDAVIDDHDSHVAHAPQLRCGVLVESTEYFLNAISHGESSRERDFSLVTDFLPVVSGHQNIGERAAVNVVDVQENDHRLVWCHATFRQSPLEVLDTVSVQLQRFAAVVLFHRMDHGHSDRIIQYQLAVDFADDCTSGIGIFDTVPVESGTVDAENLSLEFAFKFVDGVQDALTTCVVAEMKNIRPSTAVMPVDLSVRFLGDGLYPTLHSVGTAVDDADTSAFLENVRVAGWRGRTIGCHSVPPSFVLVCVDFQWENGTIPLSRTAQYYCHKYSNIISKCQAQQKITISGASRLLIPMIKNFSVPQNQNMVRADVFLRVLLQFLSVRLRRLSEFSRGNFLAAAGGENGSHYFKNTGHFRKRQARGSRLASLGGHFVLNFGGKNELAVSIGGRKNF